MRNASRSMLLVVFLLVGLPAGIFLRGFIDSRDIPENLSGAFQTTGPDAGKPASLPGFCCQQFGSTCQPSPDPITCLRNDGQLFNIAQATCDEICTSQP